MAESEYRVRKKKGYTVVYREVAQDSRLSLKARGLFLLMQSLPSSFTLSQSRLAKLAGVGRDQIRAALKELENVGYLIAEQSHDGSGKFSKSLYILQEEAPEKPPLLDFPTTGKPTTENPALLDNTICRESPLTPQGGVACASENPKERRAATSPGRNAPKWKPERFERFWAFYRENAQGKHGHRAAAVKAWDKLRADDDTINKMGLCLLNQSQSDMWRRGVGIPYASSWLNRRDWEDDAEPMPDSSPSPCDYTPDDLIGGA